MNRQKICKQYFAEMEEKLAAETERERKRLNLNYLSVNECVTLPSSGDHRVIGVLGNPSAPWMMQSMVTQITASHSYHDVRVIILYDEKHASCMRGRWQPMKPSPLIRKEQTLSWRLAGK